MAGTSGSAFSATDELAKAPGTTVDAANRLHRNVFDFAESGVGGTTNPLIAAKLREGVFLHRARLSSSVNCSAINVSIGITGSTAKYSAAAAGPNATTTTPVIVSTALDDNALTAPETVILTPSGNWPATGILVSLIEVSKR